jgi:hypothetical protein
MMRQLRLQPLQRPHRHRIGAAEQQRQQWNEEANADTLEHHHDEGTDHGGREQTAAGAKIGPQLFQQTPHVR